MKIYAMFFLLAVGVFVGLMSYGRVGTSSAAPKAGADRLNLKVIQQKKSGDFTVSLLNETGQLKMGANTLVLEFRTAADDRLADVGEVQINSTMPMPGMSDMIGEVTVTPTGTPGRFTVTSGFSMLGGWNLKLVYGNGQRVNFAVTAQ
jgi:hypothetical protein